MALSEARIHRGRPTPFAWERQALDQIYAGLPDIDPYQAWELHELYDPSTGRLYEIDLALLTRAGLFLVEIKSHPGVLKGDVVEWAFSESGRTSRIECPFPAANHKARVLASLLARERQIPERPWVQAVVFTPNVSRVALSPGRPPWLLLADDVVSRLTNGIDERPISRVVNRPMMKAILQVAHRLGLRPARDRRLVGGFLLESLVDEGEGYQEYLGAQESVATDRARIRTYLVPAASSVARRQQLERAARREAQTLAQLGQHPGILRYRTFCEQSALGPAVVFEAFDGGVPLHTFLRQEPELSFDDRLQLLQLIVEAVAHVHRAGALHRNLSPASVLVRRDERGALSVRLHRFQTATWLEHSTQGTRHVSDFVHELDRLYLAPEVLADPQKAIVESDVFSIGCLAWFLFTGQPPAPSLLERDRRLHATKAGGLCISSVSPDLAVLDDVIAFATRPNQHERADDVWDWFNGWLLEEVTRPQAPPAPELDWRTVGPGTNLPSGIRVERKLGAGGSATVFLVRREGKELALKVPHEGAFERLLAEGQVLRGLRHQHIVALQETVTIAGRPCLLLEYAGEKTLGDVLRGDGVLSLELARRFGDDLLSAVQYLEERGVTHRDIKPSNLGFTGYEGRQKHLALLDFSLAATDASAVDAGTAEWRDPWLYLRGRWDAAADRWSASAVLYHALTGVRPAAREGAGASDEIALEPERFDAAVRDRLSTFFRRAFAKDVGDRFEHAESMRQAWLGALAAGERHDPPVVPAIDLAQVRSDTRVEALPLSARARNALDRAGVAQVADLLLLPRNQLSVIRGIGTKVAREIFELAEALRDRLGVASADALVPDFTRPKLSIVDAELALDPGAVERLLDAGITNSVDAAQASRRRLDHVLGADATEALAARLRALYESEPAPGSLQAWSRAIIGRKSDTEANRRLRILCGLDPLPDDLADTGFPAARSVPEVAAALGIDPAPIHSSLQFLRSRKWSGNEHVSALVDAVRALLVEPAISFEDLARALAESRAGGAPTESDLAHAAALVRVALELRPELVAEWRRLASGPWIARDPAVLEALPALAEAADRLATTEPLPSTEQVRATIAEVVEGTPLVALPPDQLVIFAARVSRKAAASARLELYPRGMDAARALTLSLSALAGTDLTPELIQRRVAARYPDATPLPDRPDLDLLLAPALVYRPEIGKYVRPDSAAFTSSSTVLAPPRAQTIPGAPRRRDPAAQRAAAFQDQLDRGVASGRFRVVQVNAHYAAVAAERLGEALGVAPISLDHALIDAARARAVADEVPWDDVVKPTDRLGRDGNDWRYLKDLVHDAALEMVDGLLARRTGPLLLVWPGAFARYELGDVLSHLVERAERGDTPAVVLLVPSFADGLSPSINGRLPVPAPLQGQRLVLPEAWLENAHRAEEREP